jgi:hypothetical protein
VAPQTLLNRWTNCRPQRNERKTPLQIFLSWHKDEALWRGIYTEAAGALIAASVIFLVTVAAGFVSIHIGPLLLVASFVGLIVVCLVSRF